MIAKSMPAQRRTGSVEYALYFAPVFAISLIPAAARMVLPAKGQPRRFFVTDAWARAREVMPLIFRSA